MYVNKIEGLREDKYVRRRRRRRRRKKRKRICKMEEAEGR